MHTIPAKHILQRTPSPEWFGLGYNMNLYRGCTHGCIYCDSRSLCYQNPDFDTLAVKENALETLRLDLKAVRKPDVAGTGAMSDPYNPLEKELRLTRGALELLRGASFGISIATKSDLVVRDKDILADMAAQAPVLVNLTITCAEDALSRGLEPGAPPSSQRFAALGELAEAGVMGGILMMPLLPYINDTLENVLGIVDLAAAHRVQCIFPSFGMTLRTGSREYYYRQLERLYPGLAGRYAREFGERYEIPSPQAQTLWEAFSAACEKAGIAYRMPDIIARYQGPYQRRQLSMLDI